MSMWILGYGSLIWRPDFPYQRAVNGTVEGRARRFWQGSPDHRGVPGAPGRVATLVEHAGDRAGQPAVSKPTPADEPDEHCWVRAFQISPEHEEQILASLDVREQGGYEREMLTLKTGGGEEVVALTWVATPENPHWLGPASVEDIAATARSSIGPSGPNREYVLRLAEAIREMGGHCSHTFAIEALL